MVRRPAADKIDPEEFLESKLSVEDKATCDEMMDLLLNRQRESLLQWGEHSRGVREPRDPETDPIDAAQAKLTQECSKKVARSIYDLVPLMDDIRDRRRRLKAMKSLEMLLENVFIIGLNVGSPIFRKQRAEVRMWRARWTNTQRVEQRRERLRPLVEEMKSKFPSANPAKIAGQLLKRKGFKAQFGVARRTLDTDVAALLSPSETE
jgi:hypothetical protein